MAATLFTNVMVFDGEGPASFAGEVLVEGERIAEVAKGKGAIAADRAATIVDGEGMTLMPGLVEGHCHLSFVGIATQQGARRDPGRGAFACAPCATPSFSSTMASPRPSRPPRPRCGSTSSSATKSPPAIFPARACAPPAPRSPSPPGSATKTAGNSPPRASASSPTGPRKSARPCACAVRENVDNIKINISGDEFVSHARAEITSMTRAGDQGGGRDRA